MNTTSAGCRMRSDRNGIEVIVVENFSINTTHVTGPFAWTTDAARPNGTAAARPSGTAALGMCNPAQDRSVNYISSKVAVDSLRPDHGAARQAAPPRGNPR